MGYKLECTLQRYGCKLKIDKLIQYFGGEYKKKIAEYDIITENKFGRTIFNPIIEHGKNFIVPRYIAYDWLKSGIITNINMGIPRGDNLEVIGDIKPMKHQEILEDLVFSKYFTGRNIKRGVGCMIKLDTGLGKTHLGSSIMRTLGLRTCVIVPNVKLATQWNDRFTSMFPTLKVGIYRTGKKIWGDVMIFVGKSVLSETYKFTHRCGGGGVKKLKEEFIINSKDFWDKFGLTIFDEAHTYCTIKYRKVFMTASSRIILGLTATPEYGKYEKLLNYYFGNILDGDSVGEVQDACVNFKKVYTPIFYSPPEGYGVVNIERCGETVFGWSETVSNILSDPYRFELICELTLDLYNNGENIFIFTDRKEIFPFYKSRLKEFGIKKIYTLIAETKEREQQKMEKNARVVLGTYQACGTGLSIDHMTSMILASPRKQKFKQILGRILRIKSDITVPRTVYDIVDEGLIYQYRTRKKEFIDCFGCKLSNSRKVLYNSIDIDCEDKLIFNYV